jgi:uncharacterized pyridoxamine 5'-phosphate oxidase family protein
MPIKKPNSDLKKKKLLYEYIKNHKLAVISTVAKNGMPQSSIIGMVVTKNLEIICSSFNTSRKYQNLKTNPKVALVIGWEKGKTLQYEGVAEEVDNKLLDDALETHLKGARSIAKYVPREFGVVYKITPKWMRFTDLSVEPWERFEVKF